MRVLWLVIAVAMVFAAGVSIVMAILFEWLEEQEGRMAGPEDTQAWLDQLRGSQTDHRDRPEDGA